jgi:hypothetical protein
MAFTNFPLRIRRRRIQLSQARGKRLIDERRFTIRVSPAANGSQGRIEVHDEDRAARAAINRTVFDQAGNLAKLAPLGSIQSGKVFASVSIGRLLQAFLEASRAEQWGLRDSCHSENRWVAGGVRPGASMHRFRRC